MGGRSTTTVAERQTTIQVQQSSYGQPIPVVFGTNRLAGNLVWFAGFKATPKTTTTGGKGMGGSSTNTEYTYNASAILSVAEGPIAGIGKVWKDKESSSLAALNLTLFTGTADQAVWSFLGGYSNPVNWAYDAEIGYYNYDTTPAFTDQAINYSATAYLATPSYDLGNSATVPNHNFEVQGLNIVGGGNPDALASDIIPAILTSQQFGLGFRSSWVAPLSGSADSYANYCRAVGLFISPAYTQQRSGADCIQELCDATNAAPIWSDGKIKIIPYGDTAITGNGATYTPNLTPLFDLSDDDFYREGDEDPVLITRSSPADAYNRVSVQFKNRANDYNLEVVYAEDQDAIEKHGLKIASQISMDFVCVASIAKQMAQLALQRMLYKRNTYEFQLNARFAMLEPMDIVTLTDPGLGMFRVPVRITKIEEQDHSFHVTAEDLPIGVAQAATYAHDNGTRWSSATDIPPQSPAAPVIFELPADPTATGLAVGIAAGAQPGDLAYGGCHVWLSLDGTNYKQEGVIYGSSRYGTLSAPLPAGTAGISSANTMSLALRSDGQLSSGSDVDVAKGSTLIVCDGEYLAYKTATLTGTRAYNLTTLNRGLYGTAPGAHATGRAWVRIDDAIASLSDLNLNMIGQTVYIKLTAFNIYGRAEQDLAAATAYTYTITGNMKALETPVDFANVGGPTKPADNATRNIVTYSATEPASPANGDLWVDTSGTYAVFKLRSGGAWVTGANALSAYNALSGKPVALADINTTESSKLAGIQPGADVTAQNTAAAVVGQSAWTTYQGLTPQQVAELVPNMVYNPTGVLGMDRWIINSGAVMAVKGAYNEGYYFYTSSGGNTVPVNFYQDITVAAGQQYTISGDIYANGITVSTGSTWARIYIQWLNGSGAHISYSTVAQVAAGNGWTHVTALGQAAPAGTVTARVWCDVWGTGVYSISAVAWSKIKLQMGSVDTLFTDDASYGARYTSGVSIEALKPAQAGADVTGSNIAAGFVGAGDLATQNKAGLPFGGGNAVFYSLFEKGQTGWAVNWNPWGLSVSWTTATYLGVTYGKFAFANTAAGQSFNSGMDAIGDSGRFRVPVSPGQTYYGQIGVEVLGPAAYAVGVVVVWVDASGSLLSGSYLPYTGTAVAFANLYAGVVTAPANARSAYIEVQTTASGAGTSSVAFVQPMITGAPAGQTARPAFVPGPNSDNGADVTGQNISAGFSGQGRGATANSLTDLDPTAAALLTTAAAGASKIAMSGQVISLFVNAGASINFNGQVATDAGGTSGTLRCQLQSSVGGANSWSTFATGSGASVSSSEPGLDTASGTFTNSTGVGQVFDFRVNAGRTPGTAGGTVITSQSFIST